VDDDEPRLPFNAAQRRNLRNWSAAELPIRTISPALPLRHGEDPERVRAAVDALARMHPALRSRLVEEPDGTRLQAVAPPEDFGYELRVVELPAPRDPDELAAELSAAARRSPGELDPARGAFRCTVHGHRGHGVAVQLCVSHLFTDGIGVQTLVRDLSRLLAGERPEPPAPSAAAGWESAQAVERRNTRNWQELLAGAPRSCTFSGVRREEWETAQTARVVLAPKVCAQVDEACRRLRVSPYALWVTATSALVQVLTGRPHQVFRSTYANRFAPADFDTVSQVAQAVYVPVPGLAGDSLADRAAQVFDTNLRTYDWGVYDAVELLEWLNRPEASVHAVFQPAFEVNYEVGYLAPADGPDRRRTGGPPAPLGDVEEGEEPVRVDPYSAKADFAVTVSSAPQPAVRLFVRRPLTAERRAGELLRDLLEVVHALCRTPAERIDALPVRPFPSAARQVFGHASGVAIDPRATRDLVLEIPSARGCRLEMRRAGSGGSRLVAHIRAAGPAPSGAALPALLRERQPWFAGSVVPDELVVGED
jgi:Condensation domain